MIVVEAGDRDSGLRLAELLAAFSLTTDLGLGQPMADTAEVAAWFGDDIAFRADSYRVDFAGLPMMGFALSHAGAGAPFLHRLQLAANLVLTGGRAVEAVPSR